MKKKDPAKNGKRMAREWQENGKRMAREWQENGKRMAKEWQMQLIIDKCTQSETLNRSVGEGRGKRGRVGGRENVEKEREKETENCLLAAAKKD